VIPVGRALAIEAPSDVRRGSETTATTPAIKVKELETFARKVSEISSEVSSLARKIDALHEQTKK
jgi:predicted ribonuclease YlaK